MPQQRSITGTDDEILRQLGSRLARTRLARNRTQSALAEEAGVSRATIQRLEAGQSTQLTNLIRVLRALHLPALFEIVPDPDVRPLEILERGTRRRQRASSPSSRATENDRNDRSDRSDRNDEPWSWGPEA